MGAVCSSGSLFPPLGSFSSVEMLGGAAPRSSSECPFPHMLLELQLVLGALGSEAAFPRTASALCSSVGTLLLARLVSPTAPEAEAGGLQIQGLLSWKTIRPCLKM